MSTPRLRLRRVAPVLVALAATACLAQPSTGVALVHVYPKESKAYLLNPGKGWIIYASFANASPSAWEKASVGYARFNWKDIHTADHTFDWQRIDSMRAECVQRGKRFAFGIMPVCVNAKDSYASMPLWVVDAGARHYVATGTKDCQVPVWDDPVFIEKMAQLVTALTERYNGDPAIEFIDCRTFGNWGEWHLGGLGGNDPGDTIKRQFIDQWAGFDQTHIVVPISGGTGMSPGGYGVYARDTYQFGAREDSSEHRPRWQTCVSFLNRGPAVAEWSFPYEQIKKGQGWTREIWQDDMLPGQIEGSRYSYQPLGEWNGTNADTFLSEKGPLVDEWQNKMGYWFKLTEASYPHDLANGTTGRLSFKMRNDGVAPIYIKGNRAVVKAALLDDGMNVLAMTTLAGVNPFDWKPGEAVTSQAEVSFPRQAQATKVALGVFSKEALTNPDIKLGTDHGTALNWYVLSAMPRQPQGEAK